MKSLSNNRIELYQYLGVDGPMQLYLDAVAVKIRNNLHDVAKRYYEIGEELIEAKAKIPHGKFSYYVERIIGMQMRMAENAMSLYHNFSGEGPEILERFTLSAAVRSTQRTLPEEVRQRIITDARAGLRITEHTIKRYIKEVMPDDSEIKEGIRTTFARQMAKIHAKREAPVRGENISRLPDGVTFSASSEETYVSMLAPNSVPMYIGYYMDPVSHAYWGKSYFHQAIAETLKDGGSLVLICTPEMARNVMYFHSTDMTMRAQIISTLSGVDIEIGYEKMGYLCILWLTKGFVTDEQLPLYNLIASDAEILDSQLRIGLNEATYMLEHIKRPFGQVVNIGVLSGQACEAAKILGIPISFVSPDEEVIQNVVFTLSGYLEESKEVEYAQYTESE